MRHSLLRLALIIGSVACGTPASAHHSFAAEFDLAKPITLRGVVTEVEFTNPHSWIHIDVRKDDGTVESWAVEGGTANTLFRMGVNRNSLPIGTELIVSGYEARDGSKRANGRDISFKDGRKLALGGSAPPKP